MRNRNHSPTWIAVLTASVAVMMGSLVESAAGQSPSIVPPDARTQMVFDKGFASIVKAAAPAVVNISSSKVVRAHDEIDVDDEVLKSLFGEETARQMKAPRREHSKGSGVIVHPEGYILTNNHVVDGAAEVKVSLADNRELPGKVVGADPGTDIAVLKVNADHLPFIPFADSSKVEVGDLALAIGNPFGVGLTVTLGIVGATGRGGFGIEDYEDFIQTDASINPGNSGGALTNVQGELIGVSTAILSPNGVNLGIGFAIPSNMVRTVMDEIVRTGKVTRGYMGAVTQDVTPALAEALKLGKMRGALVGDTDPEGPAAQAGLQSGDLIMELNAKPITDSRQVRLVLGSMQPGTLVSIRVNSNAQTKDISFKLVEPPADEKIPDADPTELPAADDSQIGIRVYDLSAELREQLNIPTTVQGVFVAAILDGAPAAEADIHPGDVIEQLDRQPIQSADAFQEALQKPRGEPLLLRINRGGKRLFIAVK